MTTTRKAEPSWSIYRNGEEPRIGDIVIMEGATWIPHMNGCLAMVRDICGRRRNPYVKVIWLEGDTKFCDVWPKFLVLIRRNEKLMNWI